MNKADIIKLTKTEIKKRFRKCTLKNYNPKTLSPRRVGKRSGRWAYHSLNGKIKKVTWQKLYQGTTRISPCKPLGNPRTRNELRKVRK